MAKQGVSQPFRHRDILIPLADPWDRQSQILVINEYGRLQYYRTIGEDLEVLEGTPEEKDVYVRPRPGSTEWGQIARVENLLSARIVAATGGMPLARALASIEEIGIAGGDAEGLLRYLVSRGDYRVVQKGDQRKARLHLTDLARTREDQRAYASSFANELALQAVQIGRIIGHRPTIGSEREELLRSLLERHVPRRYHVATGFVQGSDRQVDVLIYDQIEHAPLFRAGNLVVVPIEAARAVIEVKSILTRNALLESLQLLADIGRHQVEGPPIFRGVFGYDGASASTLMDAFVEFHRNPTDHDPDAEHSVYSIYDMADAVCVLQKTILISDFFDADWRGTCEPTPAIAELASEAGRDSQAALFFDRLLRFLRYPFEGQLTRSAMAERLAHDVTNKEVRPLYPDEDWGPFVIDKDIRRVKAQIGAYRSWLMGKAWAEPSRGEGTS